MLAAKINHGAALKTSTFADDPAWDFTLCAAYCGPFQKRN